MRAQRVAIVLTVLNLVILLSALSHRAFAGSHAAPSVLRGRALEIVDDRGRVRASITVEPPIVVEGRAYPETVLLRLSDPAAGPVVKITASSRGSALGLSDDEEGGVQLIARAEGSFVRVVSKEGREHTVRP